MMGGLLIFCFKQKNNHKYREQIALLEARSLRAQMNPHFIFNVLNGRCGFKPGVFLEAYNMLTIFINLLRKG